MSKADQSFDWKKLTTETPPPEGVDFLCLCANGAIHTGRRFGMAIQVGVPQSFNPVVTHWAEKPE